MSQSVVKIFNEWYRQIVSYMAVAYSSVSVSAESKLERWVSASAERQLLTFGPVSVSVETKKSVSVGL
jgi:hypothetical protein